LRQNLEVQVNTLSCPVAPISLHLAAGNLAQGSLAALNSGELTKYLIKDGVALPMAFQNFFKRFCSGRKRITFLIMDMSLHVVMAKISLESGSISLLTVKYLPFPLLQRTKRPGSSQSEVVVAAYDFWQEGHVTANFLSWTSAEVAA
jgi:hypothetical protein